MHGEGLAALAHGGIKGPSQGRGQRQVAATHHRACL